MAAIPKSRSPRAGSNPLILGPRRLLPLALAASLHKDVVMSALDRQLKQENPNRLDGKFAHRTGLTDRFAAGLSEGEAALYAKLTTIPQPLDRVLVSAIPKRRAGPSRRRAALCLFPASPPPMHSMCLGRQSNGRLEAAQKAAELFARKRDGRGRPIAASGAEIAERVITQLERRSAELVLETAFAESGLEGPETVAHATSSRRSTAIMALPASASRSTARSSVSAHRRH